MNRASRSMSGTCNRCNVRCEAWLCVDCCLESDYYAARYRDDARAMTATSVGRIRNLRQGAESEYATMRALLYIREHGEPEGHDGRHKRMRAIRDANTARGSSHLPAYLRARDGAEWWVRSGTYKRAARRKSSSI